MKWHEGKKTHPGILIATKWLEGKKTYLGIIVALVMQVYHALLSAGLTDVLVIGAFGLTGQAADWVKVAGICFAAFGAWDKQRRLNEAERPISGVSDKIDRGAR